MSAFHPLRTLSQISENWDARLYKRRMDDSLVSRMRDRAKRLRKVATMAHDPEIIEIVLKAVAEIEADICKLENEGEPIIIHLEPPPAA